MKFRFVRVFLKYMEVTSALRNTQAENASWRCILMYFNISKKDVGLKLSCVSTKNGVNQYLGLCLASTVTQLEQIL